MAQTFSVTLLQHGKREQNLGCPYTDKTFVCFFCLNYLRTVNFTALPVCRSSSAPAQAHKCPLVP